MSFSLGKLNVSLLLFCIVFGKCFSEELIGTSCEGKTLTLKCEAGEEIVILDASYGRKVTDICQHAQMSDLNCHAANSKQIVAQRCHNVNTCTIDATNHIFGDPCVNTYKYLTVQYTCEKVEPKQCDIDYQCLDGTCLNKSDICNGKVNCLHGDDEKGCDYLTKYACENHNFDISCRSGEVISIIYANYGRTSDKICRHKLMDDLNCQSFLSEIDVREKCHRRRSCSVLAKNSVFGDPCVGTYKYLQVNYECEKLPPCASHEFQCDSGNCIPKSKVCDGARDCYDGEDELGCHYMSEFVCEHNELLIRCEMNETISIINASYGRQQKELCAFQENDKCHSSMSLDTVKEKCHGKKECRVLASNSVFGDPCHGTEKYLSVDYICVSPYEENNNIDLIFVRTGQIGTIPE